jgi:MoaA/NifB/PqqE/SkfB family radical SAM enzyme
MRNAAGGSSGHYQKVMELLQALEQFPTLLEVKVNMVVTSQNVSEMADMVRLLGTFKRNFQLKLVECLPRGQGTKEMMPVHDDFLQGVAAAIMATEKYPNVSVVSRTYEGDESFYPFVVFSPTGSCMIPEGQKQETVTDDDGVISILQAGGVDRLIVHIKNKYGERFDNDQINTYKSS